MSKDTVSFQGELYKADQNKIIYIAILMVMIISLAIIVYAIRDISEYYTEVEHEMDDYISDVTTQIDFVMSGSVNQLDIIKNAISSNVQYDVNKSQLLSFVEYLPETDQFIYDDKKTKITGLGSVEDFSNEQINALLNLINLTPYFDTLYSSSDYIQWVYFISEKNMINLYPYHDVEVYMFTNDTLTLEFYDGVIPENNPEGRIIDTDIYEDEAGQGLMVTLSTPVYIKNKFLGALAVDYTLDVLDGILASYSSDTEVYLLNQSSEILASTNVKRIHQVVETEQYLELNDLETYDIEGMVKVSSTSVFPWKLVFVNHPRPLIQLIFSRHLLTLLLLLAVLLIVILLIRKVKVNEDVFNNQLKFQQIMNQTVQMMAIIDLDGKLLFANDTVQKVFNVKPKELIGKHIADTKMWSRNTQLKNFINESVNKAGLGTRVREDILLYDDNDRPLNVEFSLNPIRNNRDEIVYLAANGKNINDRIRLKDSMERLSKYDMLTDILNRRGITEELEKEINLNTRSGVPFSILLFDLDLFKKINDTYGHNVGDSVLVELCRHVRAELRDYDKFGRWGGEEFLVVLPNTPYREAMALAFRICKSVSEQKFTKLTGKDIEKVTITIGVSEYKESLNLSMLVKQADDALYQGKSIGRNIVVGYDDLV